MYIARHAAPDDLAVVGQLLHDFNTEFDDPTPGADWLTARVGDLLDDDDTSVIIAGEPPAAVAVVRYRKALWSDGQEAYLSELYVVPQLRGQGIGTIVMEAVLVDALERGTDDMSIGVDEIDHDARRFYERLGFTNRSDDGLMFYYEKDL